MPFQPDASSSPSERNEDEHEAPVPNEQKEKKDVNAGDYGLGSSFGIPRSMTSTSSTRE